MNKKTLSQAISIAKALKPKRQNGRTFHITFIFDRNKLLSIGMNDNNQEHPEYLFGKYRSTKSSNGTYIAGLHSEVDAVLKLIDKEIPKNLDFLNLRIDSQGNLTMAKPCINCLNNVIDKIGFRRFYYSTFDGEIIKVSKFNARQT